MNDPHAALRAHGWSEEAIVIYTRDRCRCQYCGADGLRDRSIFGALTTDHVIPTALGGADTIDNKVVACVRCNNLKGQRLPEGRIDELRAIPDPQERARALRDWMRARREADRGWDDLRRLVGIRGFASGVFETHVDVTDLERSVAFYESLGLELGRKEEDRRVACLFAGGWNHAMVGLWEKPDVRRQHFAFEIALDDMEPAIRDLHAKGIATYDFHDEETATPSVFRWMPAVSIYFRDPDRHSLEYIARLPGPPDPDGGIVPWTT